MCKFYAKFTEDKEHLEIPNQRPMCEISSKPLPVSSGLFQFHIVQATCTAEYIGETNRSLKERVSDHRNQTTSAIRSHHISTKHPKAELKDFTIIDRDSNTLHH